MFHALSAAGNVEKFLPTSDTEILDWIESISFKGQADLFDRHVRLGIEVDDQADTDFGRCQDGVRGHEPNAAADPVKFHERIGSLQ